MGRREETLDMTTTHERPQIFMTLGDIATALQNAGHLGSVKDPHNTVRQMRKRGQLPEPDAAAGEKRPVPLWNPATVSDWISSLGQ